MLSAAEGIKKENEMSVGYVLDALDYARAMNRGEAENLVQPFRNVYGGNFERILKEQFPEGELWRTRCPVGSGVLGMRHDSVLLLEEGERAAWVGWRMIYASELPDEEDWRLYHNSLGHYLERPGNRTMPQPPEPRMKMVGQDILVLPIQRGGVLDLAAVRVHREGGQWVPPSQQQAYWPWINTGEPSAGCIEGVQVRSSPMT